MRKTLGERMMGASWNPLKPSTLWAPSVTRSTGLRSAQFPIEGYDELTVEEVSAHLGALSAEDLREVRDYEERTKTRETILEQLDRRIRGGS
jgi:hypothetical protein